MKEISLLDKSIERFINKRWPPEEIRNQLDLGYTYQNHVIEIFEIRPQFLDKSETVRTPVAKARFVKSQSLWKIYWMRGNGSWVAYDPQSEVKTVDEFLEIVDEDAFACFFG